MSADEKSQIITPPDNLSDKVTEGGPGAVSPEVLARAEQVIADMSDSYLEWVQNDVSSLEKAYTELKGGTADAQGMLDEIFRVSHDIKGQGGSFGYDLMTAVGNSLCRIIEKVSTELSSGELETIGVHIDTMKIILARDLKGDGGKEGSMLYAGIDKVATKILSS